MANFLKVLRGLDLLDQVGDWLDPSKDRVIIDRGIEASQPGRGRKTTRALPLRTIRG